MAKKLTLKKFIRKAIFIHGGRFDYSKVVYINAKTKVCIICPIHGEFWQTPDNHLQGQGCSLCGITQRSILSTFTLEEFIQKAITKHGNKYDYTGFNYLNSHIKGKIRCNTCNTIFEQTPASHLSGKGCPNCRLNKLKNLFTPSLEKVIKEFIKIHSNRFGYDDFIYKGSHVKSFIKCKKHGLFLQNATNHLSGKGCPSCSSSKGELLLEEIFKKHNIEAMPQYNIPEIINNYKIDFYLPKYRLLVEFHGIQHYEYIPFFHDGKYTFEDQKTRDEMVRDAAIRWKYNYLEFNYKQLKYMTNEQFEQLVISNINFKLKRIKNE